MINKLILRKGTEVCTSEKGHYNFHYPSKKCYALVKDIEVENLHWIGSTTHQAYKTKNLHPNCVIWSETTAVNCEE